MSPRFFFDVSNGDETILDEAGIEAATVDEVIVEARVVIAEMADDVIGIDLDQQWTMIVRDAAGAPVGRLPIKR